MRPFQWHLKENWKIPQSLDNLFPWSVTVTAHLDWWQNPLNVMKGSDLHPKDLSILIFTEASNIGWGTYLNQDTTKGLWSDGEKVLHIKCLRTKGSLFGSETFQNSCKNLTVLIASDNSTVVAYMNKQGGTHSVEICTLLWRIITWCNHYKISLCTRCIPGCLIMMADSLKKPKKNYFMDLHKIFIIVGSRSNIEWF